MSGIFSIDVSKKILCRYEGLYFSINSSIRFI